MCIRDRYCAFGYDTDARPLLGVDRNGEATQSFTISNIGNLPLTVDLEQQMQEGVSNWEVELSQDTITGLGAGESMELELTVKTNEDTKAGIEELLLICGQNTISLEVSVKNTKSQGGLFGIVSPTIGYSIIAALILGVAIIARRIKKSAPKDFSGEELVAPDAHSIPDDGERMLSLIHI